jgi:hypothetical protein
MHVRGEQDIELLLLIVAFLYSSSRGGKANPSKMTQIMMHQFLAAAPLEIYREDYSSCMTPL